MPPHSNYGIIASDIGRKITENFFEHTFGVPLLKSNKFYTCAACLSCKFRDRHIPRIPPPQTVKVARDTNTFTVDDIFIGQHLHMDYGFVRGSDWSAKDNNGKLVTSVDKYRAYLLVIDKKIPIHLDISYTYKITASGSS